jgi:hypothetical protein
LEPEPDVEVETLANTDSEVVESQDSEVVESQDSEVVESQEPEPEPEPQRRPNVRNIDIIFPPNFGRTFMEYNRRLNNFRRLNHIMNRLNVDFMDASHYRRFMNTNNSTSNSNTDFVNNEEEEEEEEEEENADMGTDYNFGSLYDENGYSNKDLDEAIRLSLQL